mmetsp:Transcript_35842/g.106979  ORF Transcript_35842/g.106979 Transcript_35842/m.106979 type:complete len:267 (-) Transcript_35842:209-1009(-)
MAGFRRWITDNRRQACSHCKQSRAAQTFGFARSFVAFIVELTFQIAEPVQAERTIRSRQSRSSSMSFAVEHIPKASHTPPRKLHSPANDEVGTASLSVGRAHDGTLEVHSVLPDGVVVGTGKYGRCLVAHKHFPEGSVIYRTYGALIDMAPAGREREGKEDPPMTEKSSPCASGSRDEDDGDDGDDDDDSALMGTSCSEGSMTTTTNDGTDNGDADADVDATTTKFLLHVYGAEDGELVESFLLDDTNSVKDYFHPSEDRRQVYGL